MQTDYEKKRALQMQLFREVAVAAARAGQSGDQVAYTARRALEQHKVSFGE